MIKNILTIAIVFFAITTNVYAHNCDTNIPQKPTLKEQRQMDNLINERLKLTQEQQEKLKADRINHKKDMDKIIHDMEILHDKIRNIYYSGIPKFQADIKTAPLKTELVLLKQNADKLRLEHRKNFENVLTVEQQIEFNKLKEEMKIKNKK